MRRLLFSLAATLALSGVGYAGQATPAAPAATDVIKEVRAAIAKGDFDAGDRILKDFRTQNGTTPQALEALSWLGRGALAAKQYERAYKYATDTESAVRSALKADKARKLDDDRWTPIALGASFEVQAHALAASNQRSEAITVLEKAKEEFKDTSIVTRLQKNVLLLSLEGKAAPPLDLAEHLGPKPPALSELKGKPVLLFFWAHWCPDCKQMTPTLAKLAAEYKDKGLVVVGPTQRYGWIKRNEKATVEAEMAYIDQMRNGQYGPVNGMLVPVSERNFVNYGSSTTPTIVLVDAAGIVRLYHPGQMTEAELRPEIEALFKPAATAD